MAVQGASVRGGGGRGVDFALLLSTRVLTTTRVQHHGYIHSTEDPPTTHDKIPHTHSHTQQHSHTRLPSATARVQQALRMIRCEEGCTDIKEMPQNTPSLKLHHTHQMLEHPGFKYKTAPRYIFHKHIRAPTPVHAPHSHRPHYSAMFRQ